MYLTAKYRDNNNYFFEKNNIPAKNLKLNSELPCVVTLYRMTWYTSFSSGMLSSNKCTNIVLFNDPYVKHKEIHPSVVPQCKMSLAFIGLKNHAPKYIFI